MKKTISLLTLILLLFSLNSGLQSAPFLKELHQPGFRPIPGEVETETTSKQFRLHGNNDIIGNTDKLLTGAAFFSLGHTGKNYSIRFRAGWTLITPVFKWTHSFEELANPIGQVADWRHQELAQALIFPLTDSLKLKLRGTFRANQVGDQGIDDVQKFIHQVLGSDYFLDRVQPSISKDFFSYDGALSLITQAFSIGGSHFSAILSLGYSEDHFYPQSSAEIGFLWRFSDNFKIFSRYSYIVPRDEGFFAGLMRSQRDQIQLSFQISPYWSPSFAYSKVYLNGDAWAQWYVSIGTLDLNLF